MADFGTLAAIIAFILNSASVATLVNLLGKPEVSNVSGEIREEIGKANADPGFVKRRTKKLLGIILSPWIILLHLINLGIYILLGFILVVGPEKIPVQWQSGTAAEVLTPLEFLIYSLWLIISILVYFINAIIPSFRLIHLYSRAKRWLRLNAHEH